MTTTVDLKYKLERMKIIYNNDLEILDFLCDLKDKLAIRSLQDFLDEAHGLSGILLMGCVPDNVQVLILVGDPFGFCEGDNKLVMYADNDIYGLCHYFKNQLEHTSKDAGVIYDALEDITAYLFFK